jgi:hypothetical protein
MANLAIDAAMRFEFAVDLKKIRHVESVHKDREIKKEPRLRQSLILSHQLQELFKSGKANDFIQVAGWLNMSYSRVSQLLNLVLLTPEIQEEILFSKDDKIRHLTEWRICKIPILVDWQKQKEMWEKIKT